MDQYWTQIAEWRAHMRPLAVFLTAFVVVLLAMFALIPVFKLFSLLANWIERNTENPTLALMVPFCIGVALALAWGFTLSYMSATSK